MTIAPPPKPASPIRFPGFPGTKPFNPVEDRPGPRGPRVPVRVDPPDPPAPPTNSEVEQDQSESNANVDMITCPYCGANVRIDRLGAGDCALCGWDTREDEDG